MSFRSFCLVLLLLPMAAWADIRGIDLYARGEFERAIPVFRQEAENPRRTDKEKARARVYLAASLFAFGMREEAVRELETLARLYPEQRVDPNRFPPNFVALAEKARATVETEELRKQTEAAKAEQERLAAEAERRRREAEALQQAQGPQGEVTEEPEEPRVASAFRVRPELFGYVDAFGTGAKGFGFGATVGYGGVEAVARVLPAPDGRWGVGGEVGYVFGQGIVQPRIAVRGTSVVGVGGGLGGSVGARLTLVPQLTVLADFGAERFFVDPKRYQEVVLVGSAGVGFNLF